MAAGLLVVGLGALLVWYGMRGERGATDMVDTPATAPAAGGDLVPPVDEGATSSPAPSDSEHTTTDVIPPEEP